MYLVIAPREQNGRRKEQQSLAVLVSISSGSLRKSQVRSKVPDSTRLTTTQYSYPTL